MDCRATVSFTKNFARKATGKSREGSTKEASQETCLNPVDNAFAKKSSVRETDYIFFSVSSVIFHKALGSEELLTFAKQLKEQTLIP